MPYNHFCKRSHGNKSGDGGTEEFEGPDVVAASCTGATVDEDELAKRGRLKRRSFVIRSQSEWERYKFDGDDGEVKLIMV